MMEKGTKNWLVRYVPAAAVLVVMVWAAAMYRQPAGEAPGDLVAVGVATVDITPEAPIRLSGYGSRRDPSEGVAQRLKAKALAIGTDEDGPAVLITADLIGIPGYMTEQLAEKLAEEAGLERRQLVLLATHTHAGPSLVGVLPNIFGEALPPDHLEQVARYTEQLAAKLGQVALEALAARRPARLAWTQGEATFAANRRVLEDGKWVGFGVNPEGPVDHSLPILRVTEPDGSLRAVLLNYACHCTTLGGDFNEVHGDWAGEAQQLIEDAYPGAVAMVAIGAGADANPEPRGSIEDVAAHGAEIAREVRRLLSGPMRTLRNAPEGRYREVSLPYEPVPALAEWAGRADEEGAVGYQARINLERLARAEPLETSLSYPVQTWTFGDDLAMVFLAGEVVVDYSLRLKRELDAERLWVNAYANDLVCYIPSRRLLKEGGYEVDRSMVYYGRPARFSESVEDRVIDAVRDIVPPQFTAPAQ